MQDIFVNDTGRFKTIGGSRKRLKKDGLDSTAYRIAKTCFVDENRSKYFYLCDETRKTTTLQAANNALIAMENWSGLKNLKDIRNSTLIIWADKDKAYNFNQFDTLKKNIPNNKTSILKDFSHNVHLEKTEEFNKCDDNFLNNKEF